MSIRVFRFMIHLLLKEGFFLLLGIMKIDYYDQVACLAPKLMVVKCPWHTLGCWWLG